MARIIVTTHLKQNTRPFEGRVFPAVPPLFPDVSGLSFHPTASWSIIGPPLLTVGESVGAYWDGISLRRFGPRLGRDLR